jgi:hypothetical protein
LEHKFGVVDLRTVHRQPDLFAAAKQQGAISVLAVHKLYPQFAPNPAAGLQGPKRDLPLKAVILAIDGHCRGWRQQQVEDASVFGKPFVADALARRGGGRAAKESADRGDDDATLGRRHGE